MPKASTLATSSPATVTALKSVLGVDVLEAGQVAGMLGFADKATMDADVSQSTGTLALVTNDATAANNGTYRWDGAAWTASAETFATAEGLAADTGASLVGFTQSGTGAVARTMQDKVREFLTPFDTGAVGDGTTDDSAAMALAVANALETGRALCIPEATFLCDPNSLNPTLDGTAQQFVVYGHGAKSVIKIKDGGQVADYSHCIRISPAADMERIEVRDLMVDANARGSAAPAGENDYQHSASILITGAAGVRVRSVVVDNIFSKDPAADSVWVAHNATTTLDSVTIGNIEEIDRTRTRHTITMSRLPENTILHNITGEGVQVEPTAPTSIRTIQASNINVEIFRIDMESDGTAYPGVFIGSNINATDQFGITGCVSTVTGGRGKLLTDGRSASNLLEGSAFNDFTFVLPYDSGTNAVTPYYPAYSAESVVGGVTHNNCQFLIDSTDSGITPTGHGIWSQSILSSATAYKRTFVFNDCKLDPRLEYGMYFYRNGYWKVNNMIWGGRVAAMQISSAASRVVDVVINGGDYSACGAVMSGSYSNVDQTTQIVKVAMSGHWQGVPSTLAILTGGNLSTCNYFNHNSRILTLDALPTSALPGDTVRLTATTEGAGKDYICTTGGHLAPTFRLFRQAGVKKGTTANRPVPTANDIGLLYMDTTLDPDGKPIWWTGTAWVDATGATV